MTAPFDTTELRRLLEESLTEPVVPEGGCNTMAYRKDWYQWQRSKRTLRRAAVNALPALLDAAEERDRLKAEYQTIGMMLQVTRDELVDACAEIQGLRDERDRLTAEVARLRAENDRLNAEIDEWRARWKESQDEIKRLENRD